ARHRVGPAGKPGQGHQRGLTYSRRRSPKTFILARKHRSGSLTLIQRPISAKVFRSRKQLRTGNSSRNHRSSFGNILEAAVDARARRTDSRRRDLRVAVLDRPGPGPALAGPDDQSEVRRHQCLRRRLEPAAATGVFTSHGYTKAPTTRLVGWSKPTWQTEWSGFGRWNPAWDNGRQSSGLAWARRIFA